MERQTSIIQTSIKQLSGLPWTLGLLNTASNVLFDFSLCWRLLALHNAWNPNPNHWWQVPDPPDPPVPSTRSPPTLHHATSSGFPAPPPSSWPPPPAPSWLQPGPTPCHLNYLSPSVGCDCVGRVLLSVVVGSFSLSVGSCNIPPTPQKNSC